MSLFGLYHLKPCPSCCSTNLLHSYGQLDEDTKGYFIMCRDCAEYMGDTDNDRLVESWNRRWMG